MKQTLILILLFTSCKLFKAPEPVPQEISVKDKLIGNWTLISVTGSENRNNHALPMGDHVTGSLIFTPDLRMSLQVINTDRGQLSGSDPYYVPDNEIRMAFLSYYAYYGTYSVYESSDLLRINIEGSSVPNWQNTAVDRNFSFNGDTLVLKSSAENISSSKLGNIQRWIRIKSERL
ncbi:MAG: lipocalin-like domain-containing protein [Bacteroidales bacterium]|nr:lipocalin-like domain-containing protein [Bacteroidales bacterium]